MKTAGTSFKDGPEAGLGQSNSKQSTDPFSSESNLFVTLPIYNIPLFQSFSSASLRNIKDSSIYQVALDHSQEMVEALCYSSFANMA